MKQEIIHTKKPIGILQVFHNYIEYFKDQKSFLDRKDFSEWNPNTHSKSAYLENGTLMLPKPFYTPELLQSNLIILNDYNSSNQLEDIKAKHKRLYKNTPHEQFYNNQIYLQHVNLLGQQKQFEIFNLKKDEQQIEIHLLYDLFKIGEPKRDNFKLCSLEVNVPTEIKINGKLDHSLTSGRERLFKERHYIFHLLGETNTFELLCEPFIGHQKKLPKPVKTINLLKELY